jgi:serine/threonine protein kinase
MSIDIDYASLVGFSRRDTICSIDEMVSSVRQNSLAVSHDNFELGPVIGQGATANVHKSIMGEKVCAAKVLRPDSEKFNQNFEDIMMEIRIMSTMGSHPNLVQFYGACLTDIRNPIILMELMESQDLESFLTQQPVGFNLGRLIVYTWSHDLLSVLQFLHDRDPIILHRDVKPANLLLTPSRTHIKLTDFGLAKTVSRSDRTSVLHRANTGTPRYRAPEIQSAYPAAPYTDRADVYSASLVIWFLLAGRRPETDPRTDRHGRPLSVVAHWRWAALSDLLEAMWSPVPELRPAAGECLLALRAAAHGLPGPAAAAAAGCLPCLSWRRGRRARHSLSVGGIKGT